MFDRDPDFIDPRFTARRTHAPSIPLTFALGLQGRILASRIRAEIQQRQARKAPVAGVRK